MANPITVNLPHNLPEDWTIDQIVSPGGTEAGLTPYHGYNYLMKMVNDTQIGLIQLAESAMAGIGANILDNGYFIDPVNRMNGYCTYSDTEYYSDPELMNPVDVLSQNTPAQYVNNTYGIVVVDGQTRYVAFTDMVRGYIAPSGGAYSFDRWWAAGGVLARSLYGVSITATAANSGAALRQAVPNPSRFAGRQVTLSLLVRNVTSNVAMYLHKAAAMGNTNLIAVTTKVLTTGMNTISVTIPNDVGSSSYPYLIFSIGVPIGGNITITAAKLELGTTQTLAYQDSSQNWILSEIPNKIIETVKCNGAPVTHGGQGMIVTPEDIGLSTANVLADAEVE